MTSVQFVATTTPGLHIAQFGQGPAARVVRGVFYITTTKPKTSDVRRRLTLVDALNEGGAVVFGDDRILGGKAMVDATTTARRRNPNWNLLWLDGSGIATGLALTKFRPTASAPGDDPATELNKPKWTASVKAKATVGADWAAQLTINRGTEVRITSGTDGQEDAVEVERLLFETADDFKLTVARGAITLPPSGATELDLFGENAGQLQFSVNRSGPLAAEICYIQQSQTHQPKTIVACALIAPSGPAVVRFDPIRPNDPGRTWIELPEGEVAKSGFRTGNGEMIPLTAAGGGLCLYQLPESAADGAGSPLYVGPFGQYTTAGSADLVCGLSALEFLRLGPDDSIIFGPGPEPTNAPWVSVGSAVPYFSQPKDNGFFVESGANFRPALPVSTANVDPSVYVPMLPWGLDPVSVALGHPAKTRAGDPVDLVVELEHRLLAERGDIILSHAVNVETAAPTDTAGDQVGETRATTAGGLSVVLSDGVITEVDLASLGGSRVALDAVTTSGLRAAFGIGDSFLVMTEPPTFLPDHDRLVIDGWTLNLDPQDWARNGTFLIVKQTRNRSLADLAANPQTWAFAETFNRRPDQVSEQIGEWIDQSANSDDAIKRDLHDRVIGDPDWQGVLIASVPTPAEELPGELSFIVPLLGDSSLIAHHVVVEGRSSNPGNEQASVDSVLVDSVIGALVEYPAPGLPMSPGIRSDGIELALASLRLTFKHSTVDSFQVDVEVGMQQFLATDLEEPATVTLLGRETRRSGAVHYDFRTRLDPKVELPADDAVVRQFVLSEATLDASYQPSHPSADVAEGLQTLAVVFDGSIEFRQTPEGEADVFGYRSLAVADVALMMSRSESGRVGFTWDTGDTSVSGSPLPGSLADIFPLRPIGLLFNIDMKMAGFGYQPIRLPSSVSAENLESVWLGVEWLLDMGSMGGLSSAPGFFTSMAICWSPDRRERRVEMGLRFPGFDVGAHGFLLQDMIGLTSHGIALDYDGAATDGRSPFVLWLRGLAVSALGFELPWGGVVDVDLAPIEPDSALGWYGRYRPNTAEPNTDESKSNKRDLSNSRPASGRRSSRRSINSVR